MDHLPLPSHPNFAPIKAPYLCQEDYDGGPLAQYPERQGWTVKINANDVQILRSGSEPSVSETSAFLQTWFYFGLLHETVGPRYRDRSFSRTQDNTQYFSTVQLEQVVEEWSLELASADSLEDLDCLTHRMRLARKSIQLVHSLVYPIGRYRPETLDPNFVLALAALTETLVQVLKDVRSIDSVTAVIDQSAIQRPNWRKATSSGKYDPGSTLLKPLKDLGWCLSDVKRLDVTVDEIGTLYYMANMKPPRAGRSHHHCSENVCVAAKIDASTYTLSHRRPHCNCRPVMVDNTKLCSIILNGDLAIVDIKKNEANPFDATATLRARKEEENFVALSHVWCEGLGNPLENALNACELARISDLTENLGDSNQQERPLPIWIDTISIPIRPRFVQQLALGGMQKPYQLAKFVLVLDSYLLELEASQVDPMEIYARILCSSWMQRLWTLQEARLSRRLLFQFADKAVDLWELYSSLSFRRIPSKTYRATQLDLISSYEASRFSHKSFEVKGDILSTRRSLKSRSVSVKSDEPLCLACLMGQDISRLAHAEPDDRMSLFWRMQETVPAGLIFSKAGRKLQSFGLNWAPETFLGYAPHTVEEDSWYGPNHLMGKRARVSENGLLANLPGILFHPNLQDIGERFDSMVPEESRMGMGDSFFFRDVKSSLWYLLVPSRDPWTDKNSISDDYGQHALVLDRPLDSDLLTSKLQWLDEAMPRTQQFDTLRSIGGLEVVIDRQKIIKNSHTLHVHGLRHVDIHLMSNGYQSGLSIALRGAKEMLAEKKLPWWTIHNGTTEDCLEKAGELLKEPAAESLYRMWAQFDGNKDHQKKLADVIGLLGGMIDLLDFEPMDHDQSWCVG